jgi:3-oxoacyl-[acyl-carrier protein] reductase
MDLGLRNKRVLVTGASRGIGAAIAEEFLYEKSKVCIVSRGSKQLYETEKLLSDKFGSDAVFAKKCDCENTSDLKILEDFIKNKWNGLDIVVANIGDGRSTNDILPNENQWKKTWDNNFESALRTSRVFLPFLIESKGCLLFISSITGIEAFGAPVDYSTAKAAIIALAKNMSRKLANVRVNVVAPGNVYFKGGSWDKQIKQDKDRVGDIIQATVPMNRFASPKEIVDSIVFLCSDRASFITGSTLVVDGGQTVGGL